MGSDMVVFIPSVLVVLAKSLMLVCLFVPTTLSVVGGAGGATCCGSATSSPRSLRTLAVQSMFLRFGGLLKPHTSFLFWSSSVVWFRPRISQFFLTVSGTNWLCGW